MDGKDFKAITAPKNVYCLVSTDAEMIDLYINRFATMINANEINYGSIKSCGKLIKKIFLNVLYMPKLNEEIFTRQEYIFVHTDSIDKRSTIYKKYQNQIIELKNDYTQYILSHSNMTKEEAKNLAKVNDLGIIKSQLLIYNETKKINDTVNDIYSWVDAFIKKETLPVIDESPISVMALLATNCATLIKVINKDTTGINPFMVHKLSELKSYRTVNELYNIISDCFYLDCQIKKGLIDSNVVLKYLISKYIGG